MDSLSGLQLIPYLVGVLGFLALVPPLALLFIRWLNETWLDPVRPADPREEFLRSFAWDSPEEDERSGGSPGDPDRPAADPDTSLTGRPFC